MRRFAFLIATVASVLSASVPALGARTEYRGQFVCDDRGVVVPLGGITVQLWRRGSPDFAPVEWVGGLDAQGFTNPDGTFSLTSTEPEDNHFIRIALRDQDGVRLKDWFGINDVGDDFPAGRNDVPVRDIGTWMYQVPEQSPKCAVWRGFHRANQDFRAITGQPRPYGDLLIQWDGLNFGTPWTSYTEVYWPGGYVVSYDAGGQDVAEHEFAHSFRHAYDGGRTHFDGDVVAYVYGRTHSVCGRTNLAFAFNEGWAEYWSGEYWPWPGGDCAAFPSVDYAVEGNVAGALANLETNCAFLRDRAAMVKVLRDNPGSIHSFLDFRDRLACTPVFTLTPPPPPPAPPPVEISNDQAAQVAGAQRGALDRQIQGLRAQLARANRVAAVELPCNRTPCTAALRRVMRPPILRMQIAQLESLRSAIASRDSVKEQTIADQLTIAAVDARQRKDDRTRRVLAARTTERGLRDALRAARTLFKRDRSPATRRLRTKLLRGVAAARAAQRSGSTLPGLVLNQADLETFQPTTPRTFVNPEPLPPAPADPRPLSTLTLSCPASSKPGAIVTLTGTLTPAVAGAQVTLTVTPPAGAPTTQTATTDAAGGFVTSVVMQTVGTWTVTARWAGNTNLQPDDAPACRTVIA